MRPLILATTIALLLAACGENSHRTHDGKPFVGPGYRIDIPEGWTTKRGFMRADLASLIPGSEADDGFAENLNVVLENLPSGMTLSAYADLTKAGITSVLRATMISDDAASLGGEKARRIRYEMSQGGFQLDNELFLVTKGGGGYVITLSMVKGAGREKHLSELLAVAKTFRLKR